jgi:hypothetical protein
MQGTAFKTSARGISHHRKPSKPLLPWLEKAWTSCLQLLLSLLMLHPRFLKPNNSEATSNKTSRDIRKSYKKRPPQEPLVEHPEYPVMADMLRKTPPRRPGLFITAFMPIGSILNRLNIDINPGRHYRTGPPRWSSSLIEHSCSAPPCLLPADIHRPGNSEAAHTTGIGPPHRRRHNRYRAAP